MNVKMKIGEVVPLLDKHLPLQQVYRSMVGRAKQLGLLLAEPSAGSGYWQWTLPGSDWKSFTELSDSEKTEVATEFQRRKLVLQNGIEKSALKEQIVSFPSDKCLYCKLVGTRYEIAIVAWAFKYPYECKGNSLNTWVKKITYQSVRIGFRWGKELLKDLSFRLNGMERRTADDGWLTIADPVPVGKQLELQVAGEKHFVLEVLEGKEEYIYDLTQTAIVHLYVRQDGEPCEGEKAEVTFGGQSYQLMTSVDGNAQEPVTLYPDAQGKLSDVQPNCIVKCRQDIKVLRPSVDGEVLLYNYEFQTLSAPVQPNEQETLAEPLIPVGPQLPEQPEIPSESDPLQGDVPYEPETITESQTLSDQAVIHLTLLDYGGFPLPNLDFILTTKLKGKVSMKTDGEGRCCIPKEWLKHREKIRVKFTLSDEYLSSHDIHDSKR